MRETTPLRQAILELLTRDHLLSAPVLLSELHAKGKEVNKTSVYRALETLIDQGQVMRLSFGENEIFYELRSHHHDHLVCTQCGKVETTECQVEVPVQLKSFQVKYHNLTVYGECAQCLGRLQIGY